MDKQLTELEQAQEMHKEAMEFLSQARRLHDSTLSHQRKIAFALSSILPKNVGTIGKVDLNAEELACQATEMADAIVNRDEMDVVNTITNMAIANKDVIHINADYHGHVNKFSVRVFNIGEDDLICSESLYLDNEYHQSGYALKKLLEIEDKLIELIAEAKEKAGLRSSCKHGHILYGTCMKCEREFEASEKAEDDA